MLDLRDKDGGAVLRVRCRPGAPRSKTTGEHDGALKLDVAAPPERGKANEEVVRFIAKLVGANAADVSLITGATSREKTLHISGITAAGLAARIFAAATPKPEQR